MSQKFALIIGNSEYEDPNLTKLMTPDADVNALVEVLRDPQMSNFDEVMPLINQPVFDVRRTIARFFAKKGREDLLLFYFSGHGVLDDEGHLYLAVKDTERDVLRATAIPATFITSEMDRSRSNRQVLILDCCHSGAFARGSKGVLGASVGTKSLFEGTGYGRVVLTASDATQYAWEGDQVIGDTENSVFTHYLIQGIQTGAADADADGWITLHELYEYVYEQVVRQTPKQKPGKWSYKQQGEIVIARNPHLVIKTAELPSELQQAIESPLAGIREGAVRELDRLLRGSDKGLALAAQDVLERMVDDDSRRVSNAAAESLEAYTEKPSIRAESDLETEQAVVDEAEPAQPELEIERGTTETSQEKKPSQEAKPTIQKAKQAVIDEPEPAQPELEIEHGTTETYQEEEPSQKAKPTIEKEKRTKRSGVRKKVWLLVGVSVLFVTGVIFFSPVMKLISTLTQHSLTPPTPTLLSKIRLRSEPRTVSDDEAEEVFGLQGDDTTYSFRVWRPREYIENDFEDQGDVVIDHATGLMWQKSGSEDPVTYTEAQAYLDQLNRKRLGGYDNWRLPTIPELMSLLEPEESSTGLYINPVFATTQGWCWSSNKRLFDSSSVAWYVSFNYGYVYWYRLDYESYVRAVRS